MRTSYLGALTAVVLFASCGRIAVTYEIPNRYVGWVVVEYLGKDCTTDTAVSSREVIRINDKGKGCSYLPGPPDTEVLIRAYYVDEQANRVQRLTISPRDCRLGIRKQYPATGPAGPELVFFVGTEEEFETIKHDPWPGT